MEGLLEEVEQFYSTYGTYFLVVSSYEQAASLMQAFTGSEAGAPVVNLFLDVSGSPAQQQRACQSLITNTPEGMPFNVNSRAASNEGWYGLYGSFLFLGLYLGIMFMMATVLIIYYKQISEGYDDHDRFVILQNVGMSKQEVKSTINKQILLVFFLPILTTAEATSRESFLETCRVFCVSPNATLYSVLLLGQYPSWDASRWTAA